MPRSMTSGRLAELERLHKAPKNQIDGNLRTVSQAQLDFYFAAHKAMPDLIAVVRAAELVERRAAWPNGDWDKPLREALAAFSEDSA